MHRRLRIVSNILIALSLSVVVAFAAPHMIVFVQDRIEDATYALHPTAAHANAIAASHFGTSAGVHYDTNRAQKYYERVLTLDPTDPEVHYHLARIAFIEANFSRALMLIDVQLRDHPDATPSAYYVRALTYAFLGLYDQAAADYRRFIELVPDSWPAYNDYAWVLIKMGRTDEALRAAEQGLAISPENAWLLTIMATALADAGDNVTARDMALRAKAASERVTPQMWAAMYPGNDPTLIASGIVELRRSAQANLDLMDARTASSGAR